MKRFFLAAMIVFVAVSAVADLQAQDPKDDYVVVHRPPVQETSATLPTRVSLLQPTPLSLLGAKDVESIPWREFTAASTGYVKLITPIAHKEGNMFLITITGYRYSGVQDPFRIRCGGYAVEPVGLSSTKCDTIGTSLPVEIGTEVRAGSTEPVVVIRIGTPATAWSSPFFGGEYVGSLQKDPAAFQFVTGETTPAATANTNNVVIDDQAGTMTVTNGGVVNLSVSGGVVGADYMVARKFDVTGPANRSVFPNNPANAVMLDTTSYTTPNTGPGILFMAMTDSVGGRYVGSISAVKESTAFDNSSTSLVFGTRTGTGVPSSVSMEKMRIRSTGEVVIGTAVDNTATKLTVNGNANFTGTVTGGNIQATYQDVAEWVPTAETLAAGTVVVLDPARANHVVASTRSYDSTVAGVISARPGLVLGEADASKAMVATTGRVRIRVDATEHPIAIGDLLVTGKKTGRAMKSIPIDLQGVPIHRPGTVVGKALEPFTDGEGEILVLLSLQ